VIGDEERAERVDRIDELELELRRLPGVHAAGFLPDDDVLVVCLDAGPDAESQPAEAVRIAARHSEGPVAVQITRRPLPAAAADRNDLEVVPDTVDIGAEEARARRSAAAGDGHGSDSTQPRGRVRLLSVLSFPDTDEVEVHLVKGDRRTIGRGRASGGVGAVASATIDALVELGTGLDMLVRWSRRLDNGDDEGALVAVSLVVDHPDTGRLMCYGVASSHGPLDAAARATLDGLNRQLARVMARAS
jgi:hypothetical protein